MLANPQDIGNSLSIVSGIEATPLRSNNATESGLCSFWRIHYNDRRTESRDAVIILTHYFICSHGMPWLDEEIGFLHQICFI